MWGARETRHLYHSSKCEVGYAAGESIVFLNRRVPVFGGTQTRITTTAMSEQVNPRRNDTAVVVQSFFFVG